VLADDLSFLQEIMKIIGKKIAFDEKYIRTSNMQFLWRVYNKHLEANKSNKYMPLLTRQKKIEK
jgi:hypothetical protein